MNDSVKIPVTRRDANEPEHRPKSLTEHQKAFVAFVGTQAHGAKDAEWQTVTTNTPHDAVYGSYTGTAGATVTSVGEFSDVPQHNIYHCEVTSPAEKIIQHPVADDVTGPYYRRNDKSTNRAVLVPKFTETDSPGFLANSNRRIQPSKVTRAASALRRLSNSLKREDASQRLQRSRFFELQSMSHSFQSLDSEPPDHILTFSPKSGNKCGRFSWSRIRHNLGRETPPFAIAHLDQSRCSPDPQDMGQSPGQTHVPHDVFLTDIPQLPFPLISLPEAAMLQHFRRERGEEDHTEPSGSFISRQRHGTVSTLASSYCPQTPLLDRHDSFDLPLPVMAHHLSGHYRHRTCTCMIL